MCRALCSIRREQEPPMHQAVTSSTLRQSTRVPSHRPRFWKSPTPKSSSSAEEVLAERDPQSLHWFLQVKSPSLTTPRKRNRSRWCADRIRATLTSASFTKEVTYPSSFSTLEEAKLPGRSLLNCWTTTTTFPSSSVVCGKWNTRTTSWHTKA